MQAKATSRSHYEGKSPRKNDKLVLGGNESRQRPCPKRSNWFRRNPGFQEAGVVVQQIRPPSRTSTSAVEWQFKPWLLGF